MEKKLSNLKVAILATDGFEQSELFEPKKALEKEGAITHVISLHPGEIRGWNEKNWGDSIKVDRTINEVTAENYDALVLPGGVMNPDKLRMHIEVVDFVKDFFTQGKPVAAICHGPWTIVETGELPNRVLTSYESIKTDLLNAGAKWVDQEVVVDANLITSRKPSDIPMFNSKMIDIFADFKYKGRHASAYQY